MILKIILTTIGLLNGGWMIFDGIHVLIKGKYFGPEKPGPWSFFVSSVGIDPFKFGIPFITLGVLWIIAIAGLITNQTWDWYFAFIVAIMTLWYLPLGTILSIIFIALMIIFKSKLIVR